MTRNDPRGGRRGEIHLQIEQLLYSLRHPAQYPSTLPATKPVITGMKMMPPYGGPPDAKNVND
jgi:hypothetical protein